MSSVGSLLAGLLFAAVTLHAHAQSEDGRYPLPPKEWPSPVMDQQPFTYLLLDRLEYRWQDGADARVWDAQGWFGGDYNRLWVKTEGEQAVGGRTEEADVQLLYSRLVAPYWYLQTGVRSETRPGPSRNYAVLGIQGLVPYEFDVEAALFFRGGEVSGSLEAEYDLLITQRLILQPRVETSFTTGSDQERGVGSGINDVQLGLRLRYELKREIAPYIGFEWTRRIGNTADIARSEGESRIERGFVAGVRLWY